MKRKRETIARKCKDCGSYAINPHLHGRDLNDKDLCDVCYWRKRATNQMKSVTIKNKKTNKLLLKIIHRKDGTIDMIKDAAMDDQITIDVRDDSNCKVIFNTGEQCHHI